MRVLSTLGRNSPESVRVMARTPPGVDAEYNRFTPQIRAWGCDVCRLLPVPPRS